MPDPILPTGGTPAAAAPTVNVQPPASPFPPAAGPPTSPPNPGLVGSAPAVPAPGVGPSGTPGAAGSPPAAPAGTPQPVDPAQYQQIMAERAQLQAEIARLTPYARQAYVAEQQRLAQPQQPPAAAPQPAAAAPNQVQMKLNDIGIPVYDESLEYWITEDASGNLVERQGAPAGALAAYKQNQREVGRWFKQFTRDPMKAFEPVLNKHAEQFGKTFKEKIEAEQRQASEKAAVDTIVAKNAAWLFEKGPDGSPIVLHDSLTGQTAWKRTPQGDAYAAQVQRLMGAGLRDPNLIDEMARSAVFVENWKQFDGQQQAQQQPAAPAPTPAEQQQTMQQQLLARIPGATPAAAQRPAGSLAPPAGRKLSLSERMLQDLHAAGYHDQARLPVGPV